MATEVRPDDDVVITGVCTSCPAGGGVLVTRMKATVATVSRDGYVKVWPWHTHDDPDGCGKMWFKLSECEVYVLPDPGPAPV
jgi:hypothetical protein